MKDITSLDWNAIYASLNETGFCQIASVLSKPECEQLRNTFFLNALFRNTIDMQRYRFGKGEYKYFNYPLPELIGRLRAEFYPPLSKIANEWMQRLSLGINFPDAHPEFLHQCKMNGQSRPTPLILRYGAGGYNTLHQDLYGSVYFPFQVVFVLTQRGTEHEGGEFIMTEQVPRAQSKASVLAPDQGDAVIFTTNFRPVQGTRGHYRANMKHGLSAVKAGERFALGIIFHDAA